MPTKKSLGQHWLTDRDVLGQIADSAELESSDTVLEIGPGLGTLTSVLLRRAGEVVAVEFDAELARKLPGQFPGKRLKVINDDILQYDINRLPQGYKVVANVPYYITSRIIEKLLTSQNKPKLVVLLVQREVAERIVAQAGDMSILAISAQVFAEAQLGIRVDRTLFTPPPKVDSQVVVLRVRDTSLVDDEHEREFFRLVRAGFSNKRKKLRSSIAAGLAISKPEADDLLLGAGIDPTARAEELSIRDWLVLSRKI